MNIFRLLRNKHLKKKITEWEQDKQLFIAKENIKNEKREIKKESKKITTTKLLIFFLFGSCTVIQIFTLYIILKSINLGLSTDLGPLQMLITAIVVEVVSFAIYSIKSLKQNVKNGIIYQTAMLNYQTTPEEEQKQEEPVG